MRKLIFALAMTLCLLYTFTIGASAHSAQKLHMPQSMHKSVVNPNASGGGCSSYRTNSYGDIASKACISYTYPNLNPDAYVSFYQQPGHNGVSYCQVQIVVWTTTGRLVDNSHTYNCSVQASRNTIGAHYGPGSIFDVGFNTSYYCYIQVRLQYNDGISHTSLSPDSPNLNL